MKDLIDYCKRYPERFVSVRFNPINGSFVLEAEDWKAGFVYKKELSIEQVNENSLLEFLTRSEINLRPYGSRPERRANKNDF